MPTQTLGKVKLTPRGAYDPAATYVPLDIVSYGGGSYCVLKNVTGVTPTGDDVNYQLLAESGADGKSPQISASKTWLVWDAEAGEYVDTGVSAAGEKGDEGAPGKAPIIGSNGNWYEWDETAGAYTDTGKPSRGEKGAIGAAGADGADGKDGADGITPTIGENGNWYLGATDTGKPSRGKDGATGAPGATGEKGADGKSAYAYAVEGGYTGTETEFAAKLAEKMPTALPNPNALTFTGAVTGSYDGSAPLSVEIPRGGGVESWELIADITTTELVQRVRITKDQAGQPFALKKAILMTNTKEERIDEESYTGNHRIQVDVNSTGILYANNSLSSADSFYTSRTDLEIKNGQLFGEATKLINTSSSVAWYPVNVLLEAETINSVAISSDYIFVSGLGVVTRFSVGSQFKLYGVRA